MSKLKVCRAKGYMFFSPCAAEEMKVPELAQGWWSLEDEHPGASAAYTAGAGRVLLTSVSPALLPRPGSAHQVLLNCPDTVCV